MANGTTEERIVRDRKTLTLMRLLGATALLAAFLFGLSFVWPGLTRRMLSRDFLPHTFCYLEQPGLVWTHAISDLLIGVSYVAISLTLALLVHRARRDIPFQWMFLAFGVFIIACGGTHFMEVITLWTPVYWLSADVKIVTAFASVLTAVLLPPLVPRTLDLIRAAKLSSERKERLEQAHAELERMYQRVKQADELKTQFFANVSHELRTPLTLILGPTQRMLSHEGTTAEQKQWLEMIERNSRTLIKHVNDLLDVARLEAGKLDPRYVETNLAYHVRLAAAHFGSLAQQNSVNVSVYAPDSLTAQFDPEKIQRVMVNLLSNAFKFTPPGGQIKVSVTTDHGRAVIDVEDSGPGIPSDLRDIVFERFRQLESGTSRGGTGLGLAIVKEFVDLHGGTVGVLESSLGGARFRVELPLRAPEGASVAAEPAPARLEESAVMAAALPRRTEPAATVAALETAPAAGAGTILVVEDDRDMNRFICDNLDGYRVVTAFDGVEALQRAEQDKPDLIITDVMMPRMGGDELVRQLRQRPQFEGVPIIVLTARADEEMRLAMLRGGAQDYLNKPFFAEELRARAGNLLAMKRLRDLLQTEVLNQEQDVAELIRRYVLREAS